MKTIIIYILVDPFTMETRYIGRTRGSLKKRLYGHISKAKFHKKRNKRLTHKENWIFKLLKVNSKPLIRKFCTLECSWKESHTVERELIRKYKDKRSLVNLDDLGSGECNKIITKEQKVRIAETLKEGYRTGRIVSLSKTEIYCYDLVGNFVKKFDSVKSCSEELNIDKSLIARVLNGTYKQGKGYRFFYQKQNSLSPITNPRETRVPVKVIFKDKKQITFTSMGACSKYFNLNVTSRKNVSDKLYNTGLIEKVYIDNKLKSAPLKRHYKGIIKYKGQVINFNTLKELSKIFNLPKKSCYYDFIINYCSKNNIEIKIINLPTINSVN